jgi:hypothetical protein
MSISWWVAVGVCAASLVSAFSWKDLFGPPYESCPQFALSISCSEASGCFIAGGSSHMGFGILRFDGEPGGKFESLGGQDESEEIPTAVAVHDLFQGFGIYSGLQPRSFLRTFSRSALNLSVQVLQSQDVRMSSDGSVAVAVGHSNTVVSWSAASPYWASFAVVTRMPIDGAVARYAAVVNSSVWYVTLADWPNFPNSTENVVHLSARSRLTRDPFNGEWSRRRFSWREYEALEPVDAYFAGVARTADGGLTWETVLYETGSFYFNAIDCFGARCVAVGEGFHQNPGAHIWVTSNGRDFVRSVFLESNSSGYFSLGAVRFRSATEVWVGGAFDSDESVKGLLFFSVDGGATWRDHPVPPSIGEITSIFFYMSGDGFATALTVFDDSTVLRYSIGDGEKPPVAPLTPFIRRKWFVQNQCREEHCSTCSTRGFLEGKCYASSDGGHVKFVRDKSGTVLHVYPDSPHCGDNPVVEPIACDVCLAVANGFSEELECAQFFIVEDEGDTVYLPARQ